jgi:hypothetical protein
MGKINFGRVLLGGIVAGLVVNVGEFIAGMVFADQSTAVMEQLGLSMPDGSAIAMFTVGGFIWAILGIWLYAAIRPRYGAGPKTAMCAASAVWFFSYLWPLFMDGVMGMLPVNLAMMGALWGLIEVNIAFLAGAYLYKEDEA